MPDTPPPAPDAAAILARALGVVPEGDEPVADSEARPAGKGDAGAVSGG